MNERASYPGSPAMRVMRIIRDLKIACLPPSERSRLDQHIADIMAFARREGFADTSANRRAFAFGMCETLFQQHQEGLDEQGWWLLMVAAELEAGRTVDL